MIPNINIRNKWHDPQPLPSIHINIIRSISRALSPLLNVPNVPTTPKSALPFRSEKVATIFVVLYVRGQALARELAAAINVPSKEIFPRVKRYIDKGLIEAKKFEATNVNIYSLTEKAKKLLASAIQGAQQGKTFEEVLKKAEKLLGRPLDEDEKSVLLYFYNKGGYVLNTPEEPVTIRVFEDLGRKVPLYRIEEIIREFIARDILFAYTTRGGHVLKVRLNKELLR